ncbi:hypothetical protein SAMN04490189_0887 [Pseudomonas koreensis]|uniref:hypothetical protein n=1 Tax=Pseudomonas koreensis TaxID=198620 RepID=UPI00087CD340|nr:hypothetical protein [Pseudomonas koreensis]GGK42310.1 hypothetical protein GCM10009103_41340 [Pseudomonas koreensis]SDC90686.1 hypothetical protein SAMN04490189_0887 [Pseudomonas koreensis]
MASLKKSLTPAEQSRVNYLKIRHAVTTADAPVIRVHPDNKFLDDEPDDDINQVPLLMQGQPFKCLVDIPAGSDDPNGIPSFIDLTFDQTRVTSTRYTYTTPLDPAITEIEMTLPAGYTNREGKHELGYFIFQGGNTSNSVPLTFHVDRKPPHPLLPLLIPDEVKNNGITKKYLADNGFVEIIIPDYADPRIGDVITVKYGRSIPLAEVVETVTRTDVTTVIVVRLSAAQVENAGEGLLALFFTIADRKGNLSTPSEAVTFPVVLTDPPEGLLPLSIPLFDDDGLVDLADAKTPLGVGIEDEYTNYMPGDKLVVTYDGILQPEQTITGFPFYVDISFKDVFNGNPGEKTVAAGYQIKRGTILYPSTPISKNVDVDLRKPGEPIDPDNPGEINPNLALVTVQGGSGGTVNTLTAADKDQDVTVTVITYTGAKEDDTVQLVYNGKPVSDADGGIFTIPAIIPPDLEWTVDWSVFEEQGNGDTTHPMAYVIGHDLNDNVDTSPPREVDVLIQTDTVPDPAFQHLLEGFDDWLYCGSLRRDPVLGWGVEVLVPGGTLELADQTLTFSYQGYSDSTGSSPIAGTDEEVSFTPSVQDATDGFIVRIPYEPIRLTKNAWGGVQYTARINARPITSVEHIVKVYMVNPADGGTCDLPT